jgi:hypothetical protein
VFIYAIVPDNDDEILSGDSNKERELHKQLNAASIE